ncbi:glycosyltransferase family 2 protein [Actinomycetospora termitidis]|uniref:Glycosyltransferase n=1 Tax=Actinomycetospora termitidis TaxID=3053470 RepID=A0ABT7MFX8_9PSEU|nr:glycosyltransferase [Actinomycetospora sp. Odt1-22]MDL5159580.1 glycosyltransferase [Actinomycetospora sp. Odt1-22]
MTQRDPVGVPTTPRVSVVVPLYQKERYIGRTVASVLDQTFTDFELVVLDNACTDSSVDVVRGFDDPRVRLVHNDATIPAPENFDRAVRLARAPLVKVLMADDLVGPTLLAEQVALMETDPSLSLVSCRHDLVDDDDRVIVSGRALGAADLIGRRDGATVLRRIVRHRGNPIGAPGNMLFRRAAYEACGGFPADTYVLDVGLAARLVTQGDFYGMPASLASFRLASGSMTSAHRRANTGTQHRFLRTLRREHADVVRRRDIVAGMAREPLTWLRSQIIAAASTDPSSRRHRLATAALGRRPGGRQRGVANTTTLSR